MKTLSLAVGILLLLSPSAFGQSYEMTIHLESGDTVTISHDAIQRIEFADVLTGVEPMPSRFRLLNNYPNPFNPATTIAYELSAASPVTIRVFDAKGALVRELLRETQTAGQHQVTWDGKNDDREPVASGVYLAAVACGATTMAQHLILVK